MNEVVIPYSGDARLLEDIFQQWGDEVNQSFGLQTTMPCIVADVQAMIDGPDSDVLLLLVEGEVAGFMGVQVFASPTGPDRLATEHLWYVAPRHRGRASLRLIDAAKAWAKLRGCRRMLFNASRFASDAHDKLCRLYERKGMKHFETTYIAEID